MTADAGTFDRLAGRGRWLVRVGIWLVVLWFPLSLMVMCLMRGDPAASNGLQPNIDAPPALTPFFDGPLLTSRGWALHQVARVDERISTSYGVLWTVLIVAGVVAAALRRWALLAVLVALFLIPEGAYHARSVGLEPNQTFAGQPLTAAGPRLLDAARVPLALQPAAHYALAQQDYLRSDPAGVASELSAMGPAVVLPTSPERTDRLWVLEDYAHAHGLRTPPQPLPRRVLLAIPKPWARPLVLALDALAICGLAAGAAGLWIGRRVRRLERIGGRGPAPAGTTLELQIGALAARTARARGLRTSLAIWAMIAVTAATMLWLPSAESHAAFGGLSCPQIWARLVDGKVVRSGGLAVTPVLLLPYVLGAAAAGLFVFLRQPQWVGAALILTLAANQGMATLAGWAGMNEMHYLPGVCQTYGLALDERFYAAQQAYMQGDVAGTADQLNRMRLAGEPNETTGMGWRVGIMREWAAHHGAHLLPGAYQGDSPTFQRLLGRLGLALGTGLAVLALALGVVRGDLSRRLARIRSMASALAEPAA